MFGLSVAQSVLAMTSKLVRHMRALASSSTDSHRRYLLGGDAP